MSAARKFRFRLRGKLTLTYLAVCLVLTMINVWSTRWLQRRVEEVAAERDETVRLAEELTGPANSTFEDGFAYVLSGDKTQKEECLRKLEQFGTLRQRLLERSDVRYEESAVLIKLEASMAAAVSSTHRMIDVFEAEGQVDKQTFAAYESSMEQVSREMVELATDLRQRATADNENARRRESRVLLSIAIVAGLLAISMGAAFGLYLTRPLLVLRAAAAELGRGNLDIQLTSHTRDEFGEVTTAFAEMAANIRRLLATVAAQKQHLEDIFASLGEMVLVCTPDGVITSANQSTSTTLGYDRAELIGQKLDTLLDRSHFDELQRRALGREACAAEPDQADVRMKRKDGRFVVVSVSASLLRTELGERTGVICVAQDLSERRRLEAELRQAHKLQAIGRLASGVAHEINTPVQFVSDSVHFARGAASDLSRLIGQYQAGLRSAEAGTSLAEAFDGARELESDVNLPYLFEKLPGALDRSIEGLERIAEIVQSMKIFAHPGQAQMAPADLNQAIRSTLAIALSEYKYIAELETDFQELPAVLCHVGEINQVVLNLVVNAAHAIGDRSSLLGKGRITVRTRTEGDSVVISVSDTGSGIPEAIRDQIFDPFFTTKDVGKGTGQGLSVARAAVVEKHRGELTFETENGKGTTFFVRLPIAGAQAATSAHTNTVAA